MTWFEKLVGFKEIEPAQVRNNLVLKDNHLTSKINHKCYKCGVFELSTLEALRSSTSPLESYQKKIHISETVGDVQELHKDLENKGAIFQAASQFNLLEMISSRITPEQGIGIYENDKTQGPACAIACGAGTIYRNYFVNVGNQIGQTSECQIDCLEDIGNELKNDSLFLWEMSNGYALTSQEGLKYISAYIENLSKEQYEKLKGKLKIGLQWNAEVTVSPHKHTVSQAYCSALPIAYSDIETKYWEPFARLILEATYEATFYAAAKNYKNTGNQQLFLTLVGGGAFGNELNWIFNAVEKSINKFKNIPIDVKIVTYDQSDQKVKEFVNKLDS